MKRSRHWFQKNDACVTTNLASVMWHNFRESCKKCATLRKHYSEHNLSLITAAAPFIAYINNWSHNNFSMWAIIDNSSIRWMLDHKRGPVIRHSVRWLGASANMYLSMKINTDILWIMNWWSGGDGDGDEWLRMTMTMSDLLQLVGICYKETYVLIIPLGGGHILNKHNNYYQCHHS